MSENSNNKIEKKIEKKIENRRENKKDNKRDGKKPQKNKFDKSFKNKNNRAENKFENNRAMNENRSNQNRELKENKSEKKEFKDLKEIKKEAIDTNKNSVTEKQKIKLEENRIDADTENTPKEEKFYTVLGVMFDITKKRYYFEVVDEKEKYKKGDKVIVDTVRGQEIGIVYSLPISLSEKHLVLPLKPVLKKANEEEIKKYESLRKEAIEAQKICKEKIEKHKLDMKLVSTEYTFDRSKLIFYFTAEGRIDFRELVKELANIFKLRIELRQIGVRDEARILGDIGVCGKELCCRTFINKFNSVSIKMARDQGLVINPAKISGVCGRLLCCINYEYTQYEEALKKFPAINQSVGTPKGDGKVVSISPLNGFLYVDIFKVGITKVDIDDIKYNRKEAKKLKKDTADIKEHKELEKE